ncbi:MAG: hypothetical protein RR986_01325 [Longicatena sp.]
MSLVINKPKFKDLLKKKEVQQGKQAELEKGDFLALLIAGFSVFLPIILLFCGGVAIFIWLFLAFFK